MSRFCCGATSLAFNTAVAVYRIELVSGKWRSRVSHWFGEAFWSIGQITLGLLVWGVPNMHLLELIIGKVIKSTPYFNSKLLLLNGVLPHYRLVCTPIYVTLVSPTGISTLAPFQREILGGRNGSPESLQGLADH